MIRGRPVRVADNRTPPLAGCWAIHGHGNAAGIGEAVVHVSRLPALLVPSDAFAGGPWPTLRQVTARHHGTGSPDDCVHPESRHFDRIKRPERFLGALARAMRAMIDPALNRCPVSITGASSTNLVREAPTSSPAWTASPELATGFRTLFARRGRHLASLDVRSSDGSGLGAAERRVARRVRRPQGPTSEPRS